MSSPRTAVRLARILSMLPWVISRGGATVQDVCDRFGYTRPELIRDLDLVFVCGLPGYGPGDLMTAYIEDDEVVVDTADYFARPLRLTPAEAMVLLAGGMAMLSASAGPPHLASAVEKLTRALLPGRGAMEVAVPPEPEMALELRGAASGGRVLEIEHASVATGRTTIRVIEPWAVYVTLGNWYLVAHCRLAGGQRVFRIDRIRRAEATGERFRPPERLPEAEVRYSPGVDDVRARIRLGADARWVLEYYPVEVVEDGPDGCVVDFSAADPTVPARLLLRLGDRASIETGPEIRTATEALRERILGRYRRSG